MSKLKQSKVSPAMPEGEEIFPGVRVTRRIALQNSAAAVLVMALGLQGCDSAQGDPEDEDEDEGSEDTQSKKGKSSSKGKSKPKSSGKEDSEQADEDEDSPEASENEDDGSAQEPSGDGDAEESKDEDEPEPEGEEDSGEGEEKEGGDEEEDKDADGEGPLSLDEIVKMVVEDAKKLVGDKSLSESEYQARVNRLLARLDENERIPRIDPGHIHNMKRIAGQSPIHIFVMEMAPNANIPLHDHSNRIGNILGWRGTIKTVNYSIIDEDEARSDGSFLLKKTDSRTITKGQTGYLGRKEHNCHIVTAGPRGATLLDMFTYYDESGAGKPGAGSRFVSLGELVDKEKGIYRARYSRALAHLSPHDFS